VVGCSVSQRPDVHELLFAPPVLRFWPAPAWLALPLLLIAAGLGVGTAVALSPARAARWLTVSRLRAAVGVTLGLALAVGGATCTAPAWVQRRADAPPNIVLVSVDTLRADHLGVYGYSRPTTPNLDALAGRGVVFDNAVSQAPWTLPAHMTLFTGLYPAEHGLTEFSMRRRDWKRLAADVPLLAELLSQHGYVTAAFTGGGFVSSAFGFGRGFDQYASWGRRLGDWHGRLLRWLERNRNVPFFLFVHAYDCHRPYLAPPPFDTRFTGGAAPVSRQLLRTFCQEAERSGRLPEAATIAGIVAQYDGAAAHADQLLGELFAALAERGLEERTLVVVLSDHGEEFFEHGNCDHIKSLYDPLVRVPLIVAGPGLPRGRRIAETVELRDVGQLILDFAGIDARMGRGTRFLLGPLREGGGVEGPAEAFAETCCKGYVIDLGAWRHRPWQSGLRAVRTPSHKLVTDEAGVAEELYDLAGDPGERVNRVGEPAGAPLVEAQARHIETTDRRAAPAASAADAETIEQLRALGYVE
jgi:arylsulfatase A-like enzyme